MSTIIALPSPRAARARGARAARAASCEALPSRLDRLAADVQAFASAGL